VQNGIPDNVENFEELGTPVFVVIDVSLHHSSIRLNARVKKFQTTH
jgi:hypothetical protein